MKDKKKKGRAADITRYILIGVLAVLAVLLVIIMVNVYRSAVRDIDDSEVVIVYDTEAQAETEYESETEALKETEMESDSEVSKETEAESDTEVQKDTETEAVLSVPAETEPDSVTEARAETEPDSVTETRAETESETAVYLTLNSACNFRSEASYKDANGNDTLITSYPEGTVVEFLEDVGGWYKVRIDGVVGYMGAKFFD